MKMLTNLVNLIHTYPAVTGMLASAGVAILAHYKLHVTTDQMTGMLVVVNTLLFAWVHGNVTPVKATTWQPRSR